MNSIPGAEQDPFRPPAPSGWLFNPPPGWPPLQHPGWRPPAGWRPDPSWPAAPPGWRYWLRGKVITGKVPFTIFGRSPVDPIRLRWGGGGDVVLGVILLLQGGLAGVLVGTLLMGLGIAVWVLSRFGSIPFLALSTLNKWIVGIGALVGVVFLYTFFICFFITLWAIQFFASS
jgi:hypothetical protein